MWQREHPMYCFGGLDKSEPGLLCAVNIPNGHGRTKIPKSVNNRDDGIDCRPFLLGQPRLGSSGIREQGRLSTEYFASYIHHVLNGALKCDCKVVEGSGTSREE